MSFRSYRSPPHANGNEAEHHGKITSVNKKDEEKPTSKAKTNTKTITKVRSQPTEARKPKPGKDIKGRPKSNGVRWICAEHESLAKQC